MRRRAADAASVLAITLIVAAGAILLFSRGGAVVPPASGGDAIYSAPPDGGRLPDTSPFAIETPSPRPLDVAGLRVSVPRLGIDLPLAVGDVARDVPRPGFSGATPEDQAFVYPGSRTPGDGGNTYIYAHARAGMFLSLWNVRVGDLVLITGPAGSVPRFYEVAIVAPRVDPTDTRWLDPNGAERLTLQTSTGPRPEDPRFIAVAYPRLSPPVRSLR